MNDNGYIVAGPTASGKSSLALALAQGDEKAWKQVVGRDAIHKIPPRNQSFIIINGDSLQVYCDLTILTACPLEATIEWIDSATTYFHVSSLGKTQPIRHYLYQILSQHEKSNVQWWLDEVAKIIRNMEPGTIPIIVGGTGMYIKALTEGLSPMPVIDPTIQTQVAYQHKTMAADEFYDYVLGLDPLIDGTIQPRDTQRLCRALAVFLQTNTSIRTLQAEKKTPQIPRTWTTILLQPPRDTVYERINQRCAHMLEKGAIQEVEKLLLHNSPEIMEGWHIGNTMGGIYKAKGVEEIARYLNNELNFDEMLALFRQKTRQYAKRQYTWFANQSIADYVITSYQ